MPIIVVFVPPLIERLDSREKEEEEEDEFPRSRSWLSIPNAESWEAAETSVSWDPSQEVAAGIFRISTAVNSFFRLVNSIGTPKDTLELREKLSVPFLFPLFILLPVLLNLRVN